VCIFLYVKAEKQEANASNESSSSKEDSNNSHHPEAETQLEFASSAEEARRRMAKKRDIRVTAGMSMKDKYELLQKL